MNYQGQTAIVTGASQGIGAGVVKAFAERGFNVVANSRRISESKELAGSDKIALVEGDIGDPATAQRVAATAQSPPMGRPSTVKDITDAVMHLTDAATVTGDTLYVDGGSHFGRW